MSISKTPAAFIPHALTRRSLLGVAAAAGTVGVLSASTTSMLTRFLS